MQRPYAPPKGGAKMQQVSIRDHFYFRTLVVGWVLIMDCSGKGICKRSVNNTRHHGICPQNATINSFEHIGIKTILSGFRPIFYYFRY